LCIGSGLDAAVEPVSVAAVAEGVGRLLCNARPAIPAKKNTIATTRNRAWDQ
jgi:hypothetical protein